MASPLVPLAMAGALLFLAGGSKKKKSSTARGAGTGAGALTYKPPKNFEIPNLYGTAAPAISQEVPSSSNWLQRQQALTFVSQVSFQYEGKEIFICSKCDPQGMDGKAGKNTKKAVKAFQALVGLSVTGQWAATEDRAMKAVFMAIENGTPLPCDPLNIYPAPFACFQQTNGTFGLMPSISDTPTPSKPSSTTDDEPADPTDPPAPTSEYGPDELLVTDGECNFIEHFDDKFFIEQRKVIIASALEGLTDDQAAYDIHDEMVQRYIPMCGLLGRDGVGAPLRGWWDQNIAHIITALRSYELLPDTLEDDAIEYGIL